MIRVLSAAYATVQDLGRSGLAGIGVPSGGAADEWSLRAGNRLCGNDDGAAAIEFALGTLTLRFSNDSVIAGVWVRAIEIGGAAFDIDRPLLVPADGTVKVTPSDDAAFSYVCIGGGLITERVLGSRSTLARAGIGHVLRSGDEVPAESRSEIPARRLAARPADGDAVVRVVPGPHADRFSSDAAHLLLNETFSVDARSDRVGRRLSGPSLPHAGPGEIEPAGMVPGAIQVPPDGMPIVLGPDGPVTGGYPIVATVIAADVAAAVQVRPGRTIRFAETTPEDARRAWLERQRLLSEDVRDD